MVAVAGSDPDTAVSAAERVAGIEQELTSLMSKLKEYEEQQTTWKSSLSSQVAHETGKVAGGLTELHRMVENTLGTYNERLKALEQDRTEGGATESHCWQPKT